MKYLFLIGSATAALYNEDGECDVHRSCWHAAELKYEKKEQWPKCITNGDCEQDYYCLNHMWEYNGQTESG